MRLHFSLVSLVFVCAGSGVVAQTNAAPTCADLQLVPAARECTAVESVAIGPAGVRVFSDRNAEDEFAAKDLEEALKERGVAVGQSERSHHSIGPTRVSKELLAKKLNSIQPMHDEGYVIAPVAARGLAVIAETAAGIFYGAQTAKQLIRGSGKDAVLLVPTIRDWPAMAHRGLSDDWSRGPLPNMEFLKREIRTLAAYKYNIFSPYFEAHVRLHQYAGRGVSGRSDDAGRRRASWSRTRRSITSRSFPSRSPSGICIMC